MSWVRFDDQYPIHRKVAALSDPAYRLHSASIPWSSRNLMDGWIPTDDLDQVCAQVRKPAKFALELVRRGLFHEAGHSCGSASCPANGTHTDGWVIHDYWDYQPSRAKVQRERRAKADRQARWLAKKRGDGLSTAGGQADASTDESEDALVTPAPPRPAPKEAGRGRPAAPPPAAERRERGGGGELNGHRSPKCDTCGNRTDSAYHRNSCILTADPPKETR